MNNLSSRFCRTGEFGNWNYYMQGWEVAQLNQPHMGCLSNEHGENTARIADILEKPLVKCTVSHVIYWCFLVQRLSLFYVWVNVVGIVITELRNLPGYLWKSGLFPFRCDWLLAKIGGPKSTVALKQLIVFRSIQYIYIYVYIYIYI